MQPDRDTVRLDALARLEDAASGHPAYRGPYHPQMMLARGRDPIDRLWKWALRAALDSDGLDDRTREQLTLLRDVAAGARDPLGEAVAAGGVGALLGDHEPPPLTVGQLEDALAGWGA